MSAALRVLVLSRSFPNSVLPNLGLWVERLVRRTTHACEAHVIAPVPYCPPLPGFSEYTRFRRIEAMRAGDGITVHHPRFLIGPGRSLYSLEGLLYYLGVRRLVDRLRSRFPFDLIHAHFSYPDGVVGAWLGRRYGVPVVITEHAPWRPWMDQHPLVRRMAVRAAGRAAFHIAVSRHVRATIAHFTGTTERIRVIPIGVDADVFCPSPNGGEVKPDQILYVGFINFNKGIDVLLGSIRKLTGLRPDARLVLVGGSFYRDTRLQEERLRRLAEELGVGDRVAFLGPKPAAEVVRHMRESAVLVLPSRAESFGAVLVEALACGTPVVATRCGGPEDIVTEDVGVLVPVGDEEALAAALAETLRSRGRYEAARLRAHALSRFSWDLVAEKTVGLYRDALREGGRRCAAPASAAV